MFARVCKALQNPLRHSFSLNFFERLRKAVRVKKRHIFHANLKRILKHSLSVREIFLVQKFNGEMLKTSKSCKFLLKINSNRRHVCYWTAKKKANSIENHLLFRLMKKC